jgi:hypothetical protein
MANDENERPRLERVAGKLAQLERMAEYRESKIKAGALTGDGHFLKAEASALRAACDALRWHQAEVNGLDQPILALQEVLDVVRSEVGERASVAIMAVLQRADRVLAEWDA